MRPSLLFSFLVLSILISEVQGIRLNKGIISIGHVRTHEEAIVRCKNGHCSGNNRKLIAKATSNRTTATTTTTVSKKDKNGAKSSTGEKEESFSVNSSRVLDHREALPERYSDILDIAGMDYSPATRKPPIHN